MYSLTRPKTRGSRRFMVKLHCTHIHTHTHTHTPHMHTHTHTHIHTHTHTHTHTHHTCTHTHHVHTHSSSGMTGISNLCTLMLTAKALNQTSLSAIVPPSN